MSMLKSSSCAVSFMVESHLFVRQFQMSWSDVSVWLYATQLGNSSHIDNQYRCICEAQPCASCPVHSAFSQSRIQFFACQHCAARTDSSLIFPTLQFQLRTLEFTTLTHFIANTLPTWFLSHNWFNFFPYLSNLQRKIHLHSVVTLPSLQLVLLD